MARPSLASLLSQVQEDPKPAEAGPSQPAAAPPIAERRVTEETPPVGVLPRWRTLTRKETRLRADQVDALSVRVRQLNRNKVAKSDERLTDNTLIRIAVDLLLSRSSELQGQTEDELRKSVGL